LIKNACRPKSMLKKVNGILLKIDSTLTKKTMGDNNNTFDAIVIGSGMSGGWAAKEFCEKGVKTLLLERGRNVEHLKDYPTTNMLPWEFKHRGRVPYEITKDNPVVSKCYAFREDAMHFFVKDKEHPYVEDKPFTWVRGYQVGGKSLLWARWTQRWSDLDYEANAKEGIEIPQTLHPNALTNCARNFLPPWTRVLDAGLTCSGQASKTSRILTGLCK